MTRSLGFITLVCSCVEAPPSSSALPRPADVSLRNVTVRQFRGNELTVLATAPMVELNRNTNDFSASDASVSLKRSGADVYAHHVVGNAGSQSATLFGGVSLIGADETRATTSHVTYDRSISKEGGIFSDGGLLLSHESWFLEARGFFVDFESQRASFERATTRNRPN